MDGSIHIPLENVGARTTRVWSLVTLAVAGLPNSDVSSHDFYDACEDTYPDTRQDWPTRSSHELGFCLLTKEEAEGQDELDVAIINDYYNRDPDSEAFMATPELVKIRRLARKLLRLMSKPETDESIDDNEWREIRKRAAQTLIDFPDPGEEV